MDLRIEILKESFNLKDISVDENGDITVNGDINVTNNEYTEFPVKIHKVNGSINWHGNTDKFNPGSLTSLKNFPDIVMGSVNIYKNPKLTSLVGCPKFIGKSLVCDNCNINSIDGIAETIGFACILSNNPISDITSINKSNIIGPIQMVNTPWAKTIENISDSSILVSNMDSNIYW